MGLLVPQQLRRDLHREGDGLNFQSKRSKRCGRAAGGVGGGGVCPWRRGEPLVIPGFAAVIEPFADALALFLPRSVVRLYFPVAWSSGTPRGLPLADDISQR